MNSNNDFDLKNLGQDYFYSYPVREKPKRSIKRKLGIVFTSLAILAITPSVLFGLRNINFNKSEKVSVIQTMVNKESPVKTKNPQPAPTPQTFQTEVINNDSYWKISKRVCGSGKYYLSIQSQNQSKPLFKGDTVTVNCLLQ